MSTNNRISIEIGPEDLDKINAAVQVLNETLKPYLQSLTADQRQELPKMGDGSEPFVSKTIDYAKVNGEFAPVFMDVAELERDYGAVRTLNGLYRSLLQLTRQLDDSIMLSGSEAYTSALIYYNSVKLATKMNVPNAKPIFEDLRQRFARATGGNGEPPEAEA